MKPYYQDTTAAIYCGNSLDVLRTLPDQSVQCCVTSPPYYVLRDYGIDGQLGLEATPTEYVVSLAKLFEEVRRVLRDDGTLFLNIGDSYAAGGKLSPARSGSNSTLQGSKDYQDSGRGSILPAGFHETQRQAGVVGRSWQKPPAGLKCKDLIGIPWMVAFALRDAGWYLRSEIIWSKRSPMPESVTDRPTKAHEQIFLFSKSKRYYWDLAGCQEPAATGNPRGSRFDQGKTAGHQRRVSPGPRDDSATRNMRSVWSLSSYPLKAAHFAAFPPELVRRCLSAGISPDGCCASCGTPRERIIEKRRVPTRSGAASKVNRASQHDGSPYEDHSGMVGNRDPQRHCTETVTTGWKPGCKCETADAIPCTVLDPFHGAGTTWKVCQRLGLRYVGIDLNPEYLQLSIDRPAVHFPHERQRKSKRKISHAQPLLDGFE